jgi:hypothetical protein
MKWFIILFFIINCPRTGLALSSSKNACIANLKQIDGAAQQWALENRLDATNRYNLRDSTITQYLKGGQLPECPSGGVYVAGRTIDDVPRCTQHGSWLTHGYFYQQENAFLSQFIYLQKVLSTVGVIGCGSLLCWAYRRVKRNKEQSDQLRLLVASSFLVTAMIKQGYRLLLPEGYRGEFFSWLPMLVLAFFGALFAFVGSTRTLGTTQMRLLMIGGAQCLLLAPAVYDILIWRRFLIRTCHFSGDV